MDINIVFSLELLRSARRDAKAYGVKLASGLVALQSGRDQWFVQGNGGDAGEYVDGSNAYEARANYISRKIDQANPQLKNEEDLAANTAEELAEIPTTVHQMTAEDCAEILAPWKVRS